ncbi:MAG: sigma-70 family RNA polymerase sigma factor [Chitinophagales bacterium]|nr:sigma-70 family RNA polymerase sigma factor [Chitinophagales bacterium]
MRYSHLVYGVCLKYFKNEADAKDGVMNIFEHILDALKKHDVNNFDRWIYTVSKNHCLMEIRHKKMESNMHESYEKNTVTRVESKGELHLNSEPKTDDIEELDKAIEQLKEEQKICVELFYLKQKSYQEVAQITGYSQKMVKSYIQNGKRNLKNLLNNIHE